ncbi:hypothetical protein Efla_000616 [Eimeria flavescens]
MPGPSGQLAQMHLPVGGRFFFLALLLLSHAVTVTVASSFPQQPSSSPLVAGADALWAPSTQTDIGVGGWVNPYDRVLPYPTATSTVSYGSYALESQQQTLPAQRLTLEDLPVERESTQGVGAPAGEDEHLFFKKTRGSLHSALLGFLRRPSLIKVLMVVAVFALTFFLSGILSRIVQVVASLYISLKFLQFLQENEDEKRMLLWRDAAMSWQEMRCLVRKRKPLKQQPAFSVRGGEKQGSGDRLVLCSVGREAPHIATQYSAF